MVGFFVSNNNFEGADRDRMTINLNRKVYHAGAKAKVKGVWVFRVFGCGILKYFYAYMTQREGVKPCAKRRPAVGGADRREWCNTRRRSRHAQIFMKKTVGLLLYCRALALRVLSLRYFRFV